jgi:hypothetical protein
MSEIGDAYLSPIASCISFAATVLSTPPLTAPMTRPFGPQISRMRAISFPINSSYKSNEQQHPITSKRRSYHRPIRAAAAYVEYETSNKLFSSRGVCYFWVKLDTIEWLRIVCDSGKWCRLCRTDDVEIRRKSRELVSMRHPNLVNLDVIGNDNRWVGRLNVPAYLLPALRTRHPPLHCYPAYQPGLGQNHTLDGRVSPLPLCD